MKYIVMNEKPSDLYFESNFVSIVRRILVLHSILRESFELLLGTICLPPYIVRPISGDAE